MVTAFTGAAIRLSHFFIVAVFGTAGTVIGALGGLFSGLIDEAGMMQGTLIGANTGALLSVEFAESILMICCCEQYCVEARNRRTRLSLRSLAPGNLLQDSVFTIISSILDSQIDALQRNSGQEEHQGSLFEPSGQVMAAQKVTVQDHPVTEVTKETEGQHTSCIICLDEFQLGEIASSLPACCHVFHLECIRSWFRRKSECPICRHPVY